MKITSFRFSLLTFFVVVTSLLFVLLFSFFSLPKKFSFLLQKQISLVKNLAGRWDILPLSDRGQTSFALQVYKRFAHILKTFFLVLGRNSKIAFPPAYLGWVAKLIRYIVVKFDFKVFRWISLMGLSYKKRQHLKKLIYQTVELVRGDSLGHESDIVRYTENKVLNFFRGIDNHLWIRKFFENHFDQTRKG